MGDEQCELVRLKADATELCIVVAWRRGKLHLPDLERCRAVAEARGPRYGLRPPAAHEPAGLSQA